MLGWLKKSSVWEWNDKRRAENILRDIGKKTVQNDKELNAQLIKAVRKNMPETVKALVKAGASPDAQIYYQYAGVESYPVITLAAINDCEKMVRALVEAGADIDKADTLSGHTPLIETVRRGNAAATRLLLDLGASTDIRTSIHSDENIQSITPTSPIEIAQRHAFAGIEKMLKEEPQRRAQAKNDAEAARLLAAQQAQQQAEAAAKALADKHPSITQTGQDIEVMEPLQLKRRKGGLFR